MRSAASEDRPWLRFYPPGVPVAVNVPPLPLTDVLDQAAADFGSTVATAFLGRETTYRTLRDDAARLAGSLAELGVRRGDRVAIILPNCPQLVTTFFAIVRLGAVAVPLSPALGPDVLLDRLADCGARTAVAVDRVYKVLAAIRDRSSLRDLVLTSLGEAASPRTRIQAGLPARRRGELQRLLRRSEYPADQGVLYYDELVEGSPGPGEPALIDADRDIAVILYTSGTAGRPRGAILTHGNVVAAVCQSAVWNPALERGNEATLLSIPMHTPPGLTLGLVGTVFAAGTLVLVPSDTAQLLARCVRGWTPSAFPATPQIYQRLLAWRGPPLRRDLRKVRASLSSGQSLPAALADEVRDQLGIRATETYGLAETCGVALANPLSPNARPGTAGIPLPGTDARIIDERDPLLVLPIGAAGELAIRGPQVCRRYWNPPQAALHGGWLATGDIAVMSPDGYVTIIDRKLRSELDTPPDASTDP